METMVMNDIEAERITYYNIKCRQHLKRVRLSHLLALDGVRNDQPLGDEKYEGLIHESFPIARRDEYMLKVRTGLHELHLVSLKSNFELFLNRLLSTVWVFHFTELVPTISGDVTLNELALNFEHASESSNDVRAFIIDKVIPRHGLKRFEGALQKATRIRLSNLLNAKNFHYWPQILTTFEVRHLVEHRDGKVDNQFRRSVDSCWSRSTWGKRLSLEGLAKIEVEEEDVIETYTAMLDATDLLTNEVLRWSSS
jgi:hypothetical protein